MHPKTLSASGGLVFEMCPARYKAEYVDRGRDMSGDAADKGTVCHAVCERWIEEGHYQNPEAKFTKMEAILVEEYYKLFADYESYEDCRQMMENWYNRQDWSDRTVISCEEKKSFPVPMPGMTWAEHPDPPENAVDGMIGFTYIRDRLDMRADGLPEVTDYKTVRKPIQADDLKSKIQVRAYALATQIEYKDMQAIWVVYDLLRYDRVGVKFDKQENAETWVYIKGLAKRIWESDGTEERLNPECRYCVRKSVCQTLMRHTDVGGMLGLDDIEEAIDRLAQAKWAMDALKIVHEELSTYVVNELEEQGETEYETTTTKVAIKRRKTRKMDPLMLRRIVGDEVMGRYSKEPGISEVDKMLKDPTIPDAQKSQIKQQIKQSMGNAWLDATQKVSNEEED